MPSFDVVSKVEAHELDNAINQASRELDKRYDLRGSGARFELADYVVTLRAQNEFQLGQLLDILRLRLAARRIDARCLELGEVQQNLAEARRAITVRQGVDQGVAKKLVAALKASRLKVEAQIADGKLRVSGKKRDELQAAIALLRKADCELPLQYENFRD